MRAIRYAAAVCAVLLLFAPAALAAQFGFTVTPAASYTGELEARREIFGEAEGTGLPYGFFLRTGPFHFAFVHFEQEAEADTTATGGGLARITFVNAEHDVFMLSYVYDFIAGRDFSLYGLGGVALMQSKYTANMFQDSLFFELRSGVSKDPAVGATVALGATWTLEQSTLFGLEARYIGAETEAEGKARVGGQIDTFKATLDPSGVLLSLVVGVGF